MAIQDNKTRQLELLQENLQTIRKLAGWSIDDLGERIGVTKQTISNIENKRTTMTLTQYIAIRSVLDYEMQEHPENEVLSKSIALLLDEEENLNKDEYSKIKESIETIAAATAGGAEKTALSNMFNAVVGSEVIRILPTTRIPHNGYWMNMILGSPKNNYASAKDQALCSETLGGGSDE